MKRHLYLFVAILCILSLSLAGCGAEVSSVAISPLQAMKPGETAQLQLAFDYGDSAPSEAEKAKAEAALTLDYVSSDESIATVDAAGTVTAVAAGTADITVSCEKAALQAVTIVTVKQPIESVTLTPKTLTLEIGQSKTLTAKTLPADASAEAVLHWKSGNEKVATVDKIGTVTAVSAGTVSVTVSTENGKSTFCTVTVTSPADDADDTDTAAFDKTTTSAGTASPTAKPKTTGSTTKPSTSAQVSTSAVSAAPAPAVTAVPAPAVTAAPAPDPVPAPAPAVDPAPAPDPLPPDTSNSNGEMGTSDLVNLPDIGEGT